MKGVQIALQNQYQSISDAHTLEVCMRAHNENYQFDLNR